MKKIAQVHTQPQRAYWYNVDTDETVWDDPHSNDQPEHVAASKALQQFSVPLAPRGTTPFRRLQFTSQNADTSSNSLHRILMLVVFYTTYSY